MLNCRGATKPSASDIKDFVAHCKNSLGKLLAGPAESELANAAQLGKAIEDFPIF